MKRGMVVALVLAVGLLSFSCADTGSFNTQKGAAIGAAGGALMGQIIGRSTAGTLIGLAGGALAGAIVGNAMDQDANNKRIESMERAPRPTYAAPAAPEEAPPGQWVVIPGQWVGGKWVPSHKAWVPVNP
jgi:hypothetical protein